MRTLAKIITAAIIASTSVQAVASQFDVYVRFKDGTSQRYLNRTDSPNALQHLALDIQRDFPNKPLTDLATVDSFPSGTIPPAEISQQKQVIATAPANYKPAEVNQEVKEGGFWDSTAGTVAKVAIGAVVVGALWKLTTPIAASGVCDFDWQIAKNGSRCGGRSAASRPGGK
jgi:hypothetical protein